MADESKPPLQYQVAPSPVTRGQIRLLVLLMLIQVVITAQSAYAPGFVTWIKERWTEHEQAVAHRAQVHQTQAIAAQCLSFNQPATKVIWEWDPIRAAKLLAGPGYRAIRPGGPDEQSRTDNTIWNAVPSSAMADEPIRIPVDESFSPPQPFTDFEITAHGPVFAHTPHDAIVFLHERKANDGSKRLAVVLYDAWSHSLSELPGDVDRESNGTLNEHQWFTATSFRPGEDGAFSQATAQLTELSVAPDARMPVHWSPSEDAKQPGTLKIDYRDQLRVYAGQPDPTDESHFTLGYELDGKPGTIDGWLRPNGSVVLEPREGKRVNAKWYPHAK
jgi:hypothetical protein